MGTVFALTVFGAVAILMAVVWLIGRRADRRKLATAAFDFDESLDKPKPLSISRPLISLGRPAIAVFALMWVSGSVAVVSIVATIVIAVQLPDDGDATVLFIVSALWILATTVAAGAFAVFEPVFVDPRRVGVISAYRPDVTVWPNITTASLRLFVARSGHGSRLRLRTYLSVVDGSLTVWNRDGSTLEPVVTVARTQIVSAECEPVGVLVSVVPGLTVKIGSATAAFAIELCPTASLFDTKGASAIRLRDVLAR